MEFKQIEEGKDSEPKKEAKPQNDDKEKEIIIFNPDEEKGKATATQLVGIVWESSKKLGELSISNHIAISQEMKSISLLLLDAHEEVQGLVDAADLGGK